MNDTTIVQKFKKVTTRKTYVDGWNDFKERCSLLNEKSKDMGFYGIIKFIVKDLFANRTLFNWIYLIVLSSVPIILEATSENHDLLGAIASFTGIVCVILVAEGRITNYVFGTINAIIYTWLCLTAIGGAFYGEILTTLYFLVMQPIGAFMWITAKKQNNKEKFVSKKLDLKGWIKSVFITASVWLMMGLAYKGIGSNRPFRDSVTDGTNVVGQGLMNGMYSAQWFFWAATNVFSIYLWWGAKPHMVAMYWVYLLNSIVGWIKWSMESKKNSIKGV